MGLKRDPAARSICPVAGKERLTKGQAKSLAKKARSGNPQAFKCKKCGGWHVGNKRHFTTPPP